MSQNYLINFFYNPSRSLVLTLVYLLLVWWSIVPTHWVHHGVSIHSHPSETVVHMHDSKVETTSANLPDQHPATDLDQTCFALGIWNANQFLEVSQNFIVWSFEFPNKLIENLELHLRPTYLLGLYLSRGPPHFHIA